MPPKGYHETACEGAASLVEQATLANISQRIATAAMLTHEQWVDPSRRTEESTEMALSYLAHYWPLQHSVVIMHGRTLRGPW